MENNIHGDFYHESKYKDQNGVLQTIKVPVVQELARQGIKQLPQRFISVPPSSQTFAVQYNVNLPIIDLSMLRVESSSSRDKELAKLGDAAKQWGVFLITNHGVDDSVLSDVKDVVKCFFGLSFQEKKTSVGSLDMSVDNMGYGRTFVKSEYQPLNWIDRMTMVASPPDVVNLLVWPKKPSNFNVSAMKIFKMKAILSIVLVIACVANADDGSFLYDRRGLVEASAPGPAGGPGGVIDISKSPGAKGDGASDMTDIVQKAWDDACHASAASTLLIPNGKWLVGELKFTGPCTSPPPITIDLQGTLLAKADYKLFPKNMWINIFQVEVQMKGGGTLDGQGTECWKLKTPGTLDTIFLPDSLCFGATNNSGVENIHIVNSKGFNMKIVGVTNFTANLITVTNPGDSLNTDGIHMGRIKNVTITNCVIATGDDCISVGDDSTDVTVKNITCGPGHGISVGSLGRYPDEKDVKNIAFSNITLLNTTNGARIKTFHESPQLQATNISFTDFIVHNAFNPIIIDQHYASTSKKGPSKVKISQITFKNIKGTSLSNVAVSLNCSDATPCEGITLSDIDFSYTGNNTVNQNISSACANAKTSFTGKTNPAPC